MGLSIKWDITFRCNLFCEHCLNGKWLSNSTRELCVQDVEKIVDNISEVVNIDYINFLGGEPLFKSNFFEITDLLAEKKIHFGFNTNGLMLNENNIKRLLSNQYLHSILFSIEGSNAEINDTMRGKNVFNSILNSINKINRYKETYEECKTIISVNCVLTTINYDDICNLLLFCENNNIDTLNVLAYHEIGNAEGKKLSVGYDKGLHLLKDVSGFIRMNSIKTKFVPKFVRALAIDLLSAEDNTSLEHPVHSCGASVNFLYLNNVGEAYSCNIERDNFPEMAVSLLDTRFKDIWFSERFDSLFSKIHSKDTYGELNPCTKCKYFLETCFPCVFDIVKNKQRQMAECVYYIRRADAAGVRL